MDFNKMKSAQQFLKSLEIMIARVDPSVLRVIQEYSKLISKVTHTGVERERHYQRD